MEFNFNQVRISRLNKELSKLNVNNSSHYDKYVKLKKKQIKLMDNDELYVDKILGQFKFYLFNLAKLYFYWNHNESDGLNNSERIKEHWIEDIISIFRFTDRVDFNDPIKELKLNINKLGYTYGPYLLKELTDIDELTLSDNSKDIIDKLAKGYKDDVCELPPLDLATLTTEWYNFINFYIAFTEKVIVRLGYSSSALSYIPILEFIDRVTKNKYNSTMEILLNTDDIKFSELAVEDMIEMFRNY